MNEDVLNAFSESLQAAMTVAAEAGAHPFALARVANLLFTGVFAGSLAADPDEHAIQQAQEAVEHAANRLLALMEAYPTYPGQPLGA